MADPWREVRRRTLARQFPAVTTPTTPAAVAELLDRVGPIQSQTARSTFLGLAARAPGLGKELVSSAFRQAHLLRGSVIRGTVHTGTAAQLAVLDSVTRIGRRREWERSLPVRGGDVDALWASVEAFAGSWRSTEELTDHVRGWLGRHATPAEAVLATGLGRYLAFGHGGLVRRPSNDDWAGQAAAEYRARRSVIGERNPTAAVPPAGPAAVSPAGPTGTTPTTASGNTIAPGDPTGGPAGTDAVAPDPVRAAVLLHLRSHGPADRRDLSWWAGIGLTLVDDAITALLGDGRIERVPGPGPAPLFDVPDAPTSGGSRRRVRLLPEFDALLCGYHPAGRGRFVSDDDHQRLWNQKNGLVLPPVLIDGRIGGYWRAAGTAKVRPLHVVLFDAARQVDTAELTPAARGVEAALAIRIDEITVARDRDLPH